MTYSIFIERAAQKALAKIPVQNQERIITAIHSLTDEPRPSGVKKLSGRDAWRIRVGKYRIIYEIHDDTLIVLVVALGHRKDIYR